MTRALVGVGDSPLPGHLREFQFGVSTLIAGSEITEIVLVGNRTAAGTEPLDQVSETPIGDEADAKLRLGPRSELYWMWWALTRWNDQVNIYVVPATESAGAKAQVEFDVVGTSDSTGGWEFDYLGFVIPYDPADGDLIADTAAGIASALNNAEDGSLPLIASSALGVVTVTFSQNGDRGDDWIGNGANLGIRVRSVGTNTQTVTKGTFTAGGAADDQSNAIAAVKASSFDIHVTAKTATTAPTTTDGGLGEHLDALKDELLPVGDEEQQLFAASVGTVSQSTTVASASTVNSVQCDLVAYRNSPWPPAMLAAYLAGLARREMVAYPAFNINGTVLPDLPQQYQSSDRYTRAEQITLLNNGVTPIVSDGKRVTLVRHIHTKCQTSTGDFDHRTREGHNFPTIRFAWRTAKARLVSNAQPNVAADPIEGQIPPTLTTTPSDVRGDLQSTVEDLGSNNPLNTYAGPLLDPGRQQESLDSVDAVFTGAGKIRAAVTYFPVQHYLGSETVVNQGGQAY